MSKPNVMNVRASTARLLILFLLELVWALDFSEHGAQSKVRQSAVLLPPSSQMQVTAMPMPDYFAPHLKAVAATGDLVRWRQSLVAAPIDRPAALPDMDAADAQYRQWISEGPRLLPVQAAPNGIEFIPGYKNWKSISSTDRTDTNTLKIILGNDIAIRAIADHNIDPWPNGTVLAKVSWKQKLDQNGAIRTGKFEQVALMVKNTEQYAATAGWGWAQWMGLELKPYGRDANVARECVACHAPLRRDDYVFTAPILVAED